MDTHLSNNLEKLEKLFGSRMQDYEERLKNVTAGSSSSNPDISTLAREFSEFKSIVWETLSTMKSQIELLSLGLDRHETAMRRKVLLLHGIPEKQNEKPHEVVHSIISNQLKLTNITLDNVPICHRLGSVRDKARPILVRFHNIEHRHLVWDSKTSLKGTGITISEFLTKTRHRAFITARNHFGIKQCWSVEGKITIILPDKSRRKIEGMGELLPLMSQFPASTATAENVHDVRSPKTTALKTTTSAPKKTRRRY